MRLTLTNLSFSYSRGTTALFEEISAEWVRGTLNAVQGPSGSGKSTLMDILGGLRAPTSGSILLTDDNAPVGTPIDRRMACAWVLQNNSVLSGRSTLDNVMIGAVARGMTPRSARPLALDALQRLGLGERVASPVNSLSGGEQQRVTIARCLISPSTVILADEPTGNLDAANARLVAQSLREAASSGKLVVVATHDLDVVDLCDSSLALRRRGDR
ncbi:ABC transporter ATP-binding protein [Microbacterium sp. ZW CA_36]|uniref:ABC transporter ATP-binding protein n=1 Tax=Microbacterium sp. ZW CA_36 TaxID=3378078 RepID=UPI0038550F45